MSLNSIVNTSTTSQHGSTSEDMKLRRTPLNSRIGVLDDAQRAQLGPSQARLTQHLTIN
ncbi:hypothetical protein M758_11G052400 [Ceratodon purpureus]|nr:hypothetical protein M758_11G052400 [Ceratodon purpureus]